MVMQASGGLTSARGALERPLDTALSGPSAAVVGAAWLGSLAGHSDLVTLDMGGTSADIGLIEGHEFEAKVVRSVAGYPLFSAAVTFARLRPAAARSPAGARPAACA